MEYKVFKTSIEAAEAIVQEMLQMKEKKESVVFCLAAGHTSLPVFKCMIEAYKMGRADFSRDIFISLDEWKGLGKGDDGSMYEFMQKNLFIPLNVRKGQIHFYDGKDDLEQQRVKLDEVIAQAGGIDYLLLGVGMNGHVGLNEPGTGFSQKSMVVKLDEVTREVGKKYFEKPVELQGGVTLSMQTFIDVPRVVLMATGERKQKLVEKILKEPVNEMLPATFIKEIENSAFFVDVDAAGAQL